jgi:hypothetical protein
MFKRFYNTIYSVPSLLMHELSHVFATYIVGGKLKDVDIENDRDKGCTVKLGVTNLKNMTFVRFVAMAPILVPLVFIALSFVNTNFIYGVVYLATTFKTTLPSPTDFKTSKFNVPKFLTKK